MVIGDPCLITAEVAYQYYLLYNNFTGYQSTTGSNILMY